jgi:hypothetical protein
MNATRNEPNPVADHSVRVSRFDPNPTTQAAPTLPDVGTYKALRLADQQRAKAAAEKELPTLIRQPMTEANMRRLGELATAIDPEADPDTFIAKALAKIRDANELEQQKTRWTLTPEQRAQAESEIATNGEKAKAFAIDVIGKFLEKLPLDLMVSDLTALLDAVRLTQWRGQESALAHVLSIAVNRAQEIKNSSKIDPESYDANRAELERQIAYKQSRDPVLFPQNS